MEELKEFLFATGLQGYDVKAYITLLKENVLSARETSKKSGVPIGRIYDVLMNLHDIGLIEIQHSHPKKYRALTPDDAMYELVARVEKESSRRVSLLKERAKSIQLSLQDSIKNRENPPTKVFWSTILGSSQVLSFYARKILELKHELLITGFIDRYTAKIIPFAKEYFLEIRKAVERGVVVKYLWSFEHDGRVLNEKEKVRNEEMFKRLIDVLNSRYKFEFNDGLIEMKFIHKNISSYFDILDQQRIILKLQNPLNPRQIFGCINIFDPVLMADLREKFFTLWSLEAE